MNIKIEIDAKKAEELSSGLSDLLCWLRGWRAANPDNPNAPFGDEEVREMNILLKDAMKMQQQTIKPDDTRLNNQQWHNPDGLTKEQVGDRYRLLTLEEVEFRLQTASVYFYGNGGKIPKVEAWFANKWDAQWYGSDMAYTYRINSTYPITTNL